MDEEMSLPSGQTVRLTEGRVEVVPQSVHHYHLIAEHQKSGELNVCCDDYDGLIKFLKQLENLDYRLRCLERMDGAVPSIQFSS